MKAIKYLQDILVLNSNLRIIGEPNPPIRQLQTKASLVEREMFLLHEKAYRAMGMSLLMKQ